MLHDSTVTYYLYDDDGSLLATFDRGGATMQVYVNSPSGPVAYLQNNDTAQTYYTIADQVGSPRVIVKRWLGTTAPVVGVYYNYHPFGGFAEVYVSSSGSRMGFTGHELDDHGNFRFYYFGERYYNAGTGQFTSVDKASQFASGFGYGNDPIMGRDADGNFFLAGILVSAAWGALFSAGASMATQLAMTGNLSGFNLGNALASGALSGGFAGGLSAIAGKAANSAAFGLISNGASTAGSQAVMTGKIDFAGVAGSIAGSVFATKTLGNFNVKAGTSGLSNMAREMTFEGVKGSVSGFVGGGIAAGIRGDNIARGAAIGAAAGMAGGAGAAATKLLILGWPIPEENSDPLVTEALTDMKSASGSSERPVYRQGGLWGIASSVGIAPAGFAGFGRDIIMNTGDYVEWNQYLWIHESAHFYLQDQRDGFAPALGVQLEDRFHKDPYNTYWGGGTSGEWYAQRIANGYVYGDPFRGVW